MDELPPGEGDPTRLIAAALAHFSHGFCIWDEDLRIVAVNCAYLALYRLPPDRDYRGVSLREIAELNASLGRHGGLPADEIHTMYLARFVDVPGSRVAEHSLDGRMVRTTVDRVPGMGWVALHQDVTREHEIQLLAQERTLQLQVQNIRFGAAINNMLHGVSMFDDEKRLIICNRQYAEMYGLPEHLTRPGTSFWDMLDDGARTGMVSVADPDDRVRILTAVIDSGRTFKENVKMENGRVIAVLHQPMTGGGWLSTHEDVTEQHGHEEKIRHLARHDALTDLPNRVLFREEMDKIEARMGGGEIMAVLQVDLDRFKDVNDTLGHAVGDAVLIEVARRMREASRESDVVARIGGDEFALLVGPLDNARQAARIADRIVKSVARPLSIDGNQIMIGASIGIAMAPPDGTDPETLLKNADLALYQAKGDGRGAYRFFEQGMDEALRNRRALELSLRDALAGEQFRLVFQPLFNLAENRIAGLEALLRWDHPERGLVPPGDFLPVAEETGMIVRIGDWVLHQACRAAAGWPESVRVAVNLSPMQFKHRGLPEAIRSALAESNLPPDRLELEITEHLLATDTEATLATLGRLRAMGVRIALDDFGLEHSSLRHLQCFRFDKVKIDRSFVRSLLGGEDSMAVVTAMIGLGHSLGLATTAEGIETEEELEAVRAHGCEEVQGFLFSAPLPASAIDALLATTSGELRKTPKRALNAL